MIMMIIGLETFSESRSEVKEGPEPLEVAEPFAFNRIDSSLKQLDNQETKHGKKYWKRHQESWKNRCDFVLFEKLYFSVDKNIWREKFYKVHWYNENLLQ